VPRDERGKGFVGTLLDIFAQQNDVIQFLHLPINAADREKPTMFFSGLTIEIREDAGPVAGTGMGQTS
jgi:hypothetical protein